MANIKDHVLIDTITEIVEESDEGGGSLPFGESNTASNIGTEGEGLFDHKEGVDLQFKNLKALDGLTITPDEEKHTLEIEGLHVGTTPPADTNKLWFNKDFKKLFYYDETRAKWLSVQSTVFSFGADVTDGSPLRAFGIVNAAAGTGVIIPVGMVVTDIWAKAQTGNATKKFYLRKGGIAGTIVNEFDLVALKYTSQSINANLNINDDIWAYSSPDGDQSRDITIVYLAKQRFIP